MRALFCRQHCIPMVLQDNPCRGWMTGRLKSISAHTREEIADVLTRPAIRRKYPRLTEERANAMLARLDAHATIVSSVFRSLEYPRDPDDEPVINLAIHVRAHYLVSRDKDLLDLDRSRDFRLLYPFLRIVDPVTFLEEIERARLRQEVQAVSISDDQETSTALPPEQSAEQKVVEES